MIRDLTDEEARRALVLKWGMTDPEILPAWVAEMDYAVADVITGFKGAMVFGVAAVGIAVNLLVAWMLSRDHQNMNTRAAMVNVMANCPARLDRRGGGRRRHPLHRLGTDRPAAVGVRLAADP